jgi:hypothetical protein
MKIICHRGYWKKKSEQNQLEACLKAASLFDGLEIDLKNKDGEIVLSHDPLSKKQTYTNLEEILKKSPDTFFAFNIKEDGLSHSLKKLITKYKITKYTCFDLSRPEFLKYQDSKLKVYHRFGDQDLLPPPSKCEGIVLDVFKQKNFNRVLNKLKLSPTIPLFIISPELHGENHTNVWKTLRLFENSHKIPLYLCTDLFHEATVFFKDR